MTANNTDDLKLAKRVIYLCDPHKNQACAKTVCYKVAKGNDICRATTNIRYAQRDENGEPITIAWEDL